MLSLELVCDIMLAFSQYVVFKVHYVLVLIENLELDFRRFLLDKEIEIHIPNWIYSLRHPFGHFYNVLNLNLNIGIALS